MEMVFGISSRLTGFRCYLMHLSRFLPKSRFSRGVALLMGGSALGQAIVILTTPLLTRLYTPEELGLASALLALLMILGVAISLRYDITIPLPEDDESGASLLAAALVIAFIISGLLALILLLMGNWLVRVLNLPELLPYLWILPLGTLAMGIYQALSYWAVRKREFKVIAQTKINQSVGQVIVQIVLGLLQVGPIGLMLGYIIGLGGGSGTLGRLTGAGHDNILRSVSFASVRRVLVRYKAFPIFSTPSGLLNSAGLRIAPLIVASLYGLEVGGWFSFANRLISIPVALMATSIGQAFFAEASLLIYQNPDALRHRYYKLARHLFLLALPLATILILFGTQLVELVFGTAWSQAGSYLKFMALMLIGQLVVSPISVLGVYQRPQWQLVWDIGRLIVTTACLLGKVIFNWDALTSIGAYSITMLLSYFVLFMMNVYVMRLHPENKEPLYERT